MKKETIKSIILTLLIINCIQLTVQIWSNDRLLPEGGGFFSYASALPGMDKLFSLFNRSSAAGRISDNTTLPDKIVINGGGARTVSYSGSDAFSSALKFIAPYVESMFTQGAAPEQVTQEQWQTMLRSKSIYIDFGFSADSKNIAEFFGTRAQPGTGFSSAESLTLYPESVLNATSVCFKSGSEITKYTINGSADEILKFIDDETIGKKHEDAFAFEVRLDKDSSSSAIKKKVVLESYVLLTTDSEPVNKLIVSDVFENSDDASKKADKILRAFGYTASQLRKTVTGDGAVSYFENSATVKIHPDGLVEYRAVATDKGIKISDGKAAPSKIISELLNITKDVISYAGLADTVNLRLRSPLNETPVSEYTAKFARYYNGVPVIAHGSEETGGSSVYARFKDGYITEFKIYLQNLRLSEDTTTPPTVLETIDAFCETLDPGIFELPIDNIYRCYYTGGEGEYPSKWCIEHGGVISVP